MEATMKNDFKYPAILVTDFVNQLYFHHLGFGSGVMYVSEKKHIYISWPIREKAELPEGVELLQIERGNLGNALKRLIAEEQIGYLTVEASVPLDIYSLVSTEIEDIRIASEDIIANRREVKSAWELEQIQKACEITDSAFREVLDIIKPGISELEIAAFLEYRMRIKGSEEPNKTIVAAGKNSAYPHHWATDQRIHKGDFVTMDFGCTVNGYHSDLTRTVVVGKPSERQKRIYQLVLTAQQAGIDALREGVKGKDIDKIARNVIDSTEFKGSFIHGLGHGIGLGIHEGTGLGQDENRRLKSGMVVSIEPGIYLENYGGVRIEDLAVVGKNNARLMEFSPKELISL
jgi:Xaa-Pro aminopeptidase